MLAWLFAAGDEQNSRMVRGRDSVCCSYLGGAPDRGTHRSAAPRPGCSTRSRFCRSRRKRRRSSSERVELRFNNNRRSAIELRLASSRERCALPSTVSNCTRPESSFARRQTEAGMPATSARKSVMYCDLPPVGRLYGHAQALDVGVQLVQVGQLQVVRGKQRDRAGELLHVLDDRPRKAGAVAIRRRLSHLGYKARGAGLEGVRGGDAREDTLQQRDLGLLGGDGAAYVRHQANQGNLTEIRRLARHVGSCDELHIAGWRHEDVVGHCRVFA
eukprot:scaffold4501_cov108-Isochrysis_galbana.AAC.7